MARSSSKKSPPIKAVQKNKQSPKVSKPEPNKSAGKSDRNPVTRICRALAELKAINLHRPERDMVAVMAGYDGMSAGFKKAVGEAKKSKLIDYGDDKTLELTSLGQEKAPKVNTIRSNQELHAKLEEILLKKKVPRKVSTVLGLLGDGNAHSIAEIADATDYQDLRSPGFKKFIGTIGAMKAFFVRENATMKLSEAAFPFGRPV